MMGWSKTVGLGVRVLVVVAAAYLGSRLFMSNSSIDFEKLWVAGRAWSLGQSAYGPDFPRIYELQFGYQTPQRWFYPPYWYPFVTALGFLPYKVAATLWGLLNVASVAASAWLFSRALPKRSRLGFPIVFSALALCEMTAMAIGMGQTSLILLFGISLLYYAGDRRGLLAAGLLLLMLKPQVGLFFAIFYLVRGRFAAVAIAACAALLFMLPPLLIHGPSEMMGFLHNAGAYGEDNPANLPAELVGIYQISSLLEPTADIRWIGSLLMLLVAAAVGRSRSAQDTALHVLVVATMLFVPLHAYDATILLLPALWLAFELNWVAIAVVLMMIRPSLPAALGIANPSSEVFPSTLWVSLATLLALVPVIARIRHSSGALTTSSDSQVAAGKGEKAAH